MKLSLRLTNAGVISIVGLFVALLLFRDIAVHSGTTALPSPAGSAVLDKVVTKEFCLVDSQGRTRARIAVDNSDAPSVQLFDKQGTRRANFRLNQDDVPSLRLYDDEGRVRSVTGFALGTMDPVVVYFDTNGMGRMVGSSQDDSLLVSRIFRDEDTVRAGGMGISDSFFTPQPMHEDSETHYTFAAPPPPTP